MQPGHDVLPLFAQRQTVAQLGAGEHGAGGVDAHGAGGFHGERAEFVQAHVHFVSDVAEVAPAAGGAAVVHLEVLDDAGGVHLDRLGVLAADVEHGARVGIHHVRAEAMAEDFGTDLFPRERQRDPAVAGADHGGIFQRDFQRRAHDLRHAVCVRVDAGERAQEAVAHVLVRGAVLHLDNRLVVDVQQQIVGEGRGFCHVLRHRHEARAGDVTEEIGFASRAGGEQVGRLRAQPDEYGVDGLAHGVAGVAEAFGAGVLAAGFRQVGQPVEELFEAETAVEIGEEDVDPVGKIGKCGESAPHQGEAGGDQCFVTRHPAGGVVVRA